ncbi:hypothetical protein BJ912DRAFT_1072234 [Pholiota molesta]|nr:hypothetical protein BJ912DRAFT_1072234 [Pholiota molesta]
MPSGNGPGFEGTQRDFLKNLIPAFLAKTAYREPAAIGKPLPEDDPDLSKWVAARRDEFEAKFSLDIIDNSQKSNQKIRESFDAFFRNAKSKAKTKWEGAAAQEFKRIIIQGLASKTPSPLPTSSSSSIPASIEPNSPPSDVKLLWSALLKGTIVTGRKLFEDEHRSSISDEVNTIRKHDSIGPKMHVGMMNSKLKARWEGLRDTERAEWENKAEDLKASDKIGLIYRNQALIRDHISLLLSSLIGPGEGGNHKIGHARFHVLWGFRDSKENLKTGCLDITGENFGERAGYDLFNGDYATNVMKPWRECCQKTIGKNIPMPKSASHAIMFDEDLHPLLPHVDVNNITGEALRMILSEFIDAKWVWFRTTVLDDMDSIPHEIPWADDNFTSFLSPSFKSLRNPLSMKPPLLFDLYEHLATESESILEIFTLTSESAKPPSSPPPTIMPSKLHSPSKSPVLPSEVRLDDPPRVPSPTTAALPSIPAIRSPRPRFPSPSSPATEPSKRVLATITATADNHPSGVESSMSASVPGPFGVQPSVSVASRSALSSTTPPSFSSTDESLPLPPSLMPVAPSLPESIATASHSAPGTSFPSESSVAAAIPTPKPAMVPIQLPDENGTREDSPPVAATLRTDGVVGAAKRDRPDTTEADGTDAQPQKRQKKTNKEPKSISASRRSARSASAKTGNSNQPPLGTATQPGVESAASAATPIVPNNTDTASSPVSLNRKGNPRKKSKFWTYVA